MASYVTPKKNVAFICYVKLPSATLSGLFQTNPTLASGDVKVEIDGGAAANLTTLPTVTPSGGSSVKVSLSTSEMNGDNIVVTFKDQTSPAEWCDTTITIQTSARQIDDLAYPATSGRSMVVDAAGLVDANMVKAGPTGSGTAQTARDLGASVLLSSGTGTGQISLSSGAVLLQPTQTGVTIPTVTTLTNAPSDSAGTTTLLSRLSAARAGYLDNLSAGAAALESSLQGLITTIGASAAGVASAVWGAVTRTLTAGTNIVLAKGTGITGFNDLSAAQVNAEADTALADVGVTTTVTGRIDAAISSRLAAGSYTAPLDAAGTRTALGLASANLDTQLDALPTNADLATALAAADDAVLAAISALSIPTASQNGSAVLAAAYEGVETVQQGLRLMRAALVGKASGLDTTTASFRSRADDKDRIVATVDADGNRTAVTTDAS